MAWGGIPLVHMGDELGLTNDYGYRDDPTRAGDNRWLHRPRMRWSVAGRRHREGTVEHRLFSGIAALARVRRGTPHLHARWPALVVDAGVAPVFAHLRRHPTGDLLAVYNFADRGVALPAEILREHGLESPVDRISGLPPPMGDGGIRLAPYARLWLTASPAGGRSLE